MLKCPECGSNNIEAGGTCPLECMDCGAGLELDGAFGDEEDA